MHVASWVLPIVAFVVLLFLAGLTKPMYDRGQKLKAYLITFGISIAVAVAGLVCAIIANQQHKAIGGQIVIVVNAVLIILELVLFRQASKPYRGQNKDKSN